MGGGVQGVRLARFSVLSSSNYPSQEQLGVRGVGWCLGSGFRVEGSGFRVRV